MFERSATLSPLSNSLQPLWRYMPANRLLDLLESQELYFRNLAALEDAYEGALTHRATEQLANWFQAQNKSTRVEAYEEVEKYRMQHKEFYVNCWHMNSHESYLMWRAYSDRGYAIQTTFERLQCALDVTAVAITGGVVDYVDFERDLTPVGNVFHHVATKDLPYKDEREFRLVLWDLDPRNQSIQRTPEAVRIGVDVPMLITSIVASPFARPMDHALEKAIEHHGLRVSQTRVNVRRQTAARCTDGV